MNDIPQRLSPDAFGVLEVIIQQRITEINYKHPEDTLAQFFPGKKTADMQAYYTALIQEINTVANRDALEPRVKYRVMGLEFGTRYVVDLEQVSKLHEEQKAIRVAEAENLRNPRPA